MNIGKTVEVSFEKESDSLPLLYQRHKELLEIIDSLTGLLSNQHYITFKEMVLDKEVEKSKEELTMATDIVRIYRLQGFLSGKNFSDLSRMQKEYRDELQLVKGRIKEQKQT